MDMSQCLVIRRTCIKDLINALFTYSFICNINLIHDLIHDVS